MTAPPPPRRPRWALATLGLGIGLLASCSSGSDSAANHGDHATSSSAADHSGGHSAGGAVFSTPAPTGCATKMPGDVMTAAEATVSLSPTSVCPSYVTVAAGTTITFANTGSDAATITVHRGLPPNASTGYLDAPSTTGPTPVLAKATVAPAAKATNAIDAPGTYYFTFDKIPTFIGTIEVKSPQ